MQMLYRPILSATLADVKPHKMHLNFHFKKFLQSTSLLTDLTVYSPFISSKMQKGIFFHIFHKDPSSAEDGPFLVWFCPVLPRIISGLGLQRAQT